MEGNKEPFVDPFNVTNTTNKEIDYQKIISQFGCSEIPESLIQRFEKLTNKKAHIFLKRGIFFSHRDFDKFLDYYEQKKPIYLYTGRGPSSESMHLGHLLPFIFTKYLQETLNIPLVIQLTDDEKYFFNKDNKHDLSYYTKLGVENCKDILALNFNKDKTFIFMNSQYSGHLYENAARFQKCLTYNQVKNIFGLNGSDNVGRSSFPAFQAVPSFSTSFKHIFGDNTDVLCLIPQGIDQDPYFRMTRDIAERLKFKKPCCIHSKFFPALQGFNTKMSASDNNSAIFLTDTAKQIKNKINKFAFSGGKSTTEEHRKYGADLEVDISISYLRFFMEDDDKLSEICEKYKKGELLTGEVKKILIELLTEIVTSHQESRKSITDDIVKEYMEIRKIDFNY